MSSDLEPIGDGPIDTAAAETRSRNPKNSGNGAQPQPLMSDAKFVELAKAASAPAPSILGGGKADGRVADIFDDIEALKGGQSFVETGTAKPLLRQVPVRRPKNTDWFRVAPDPKYRQTLTLMENKDESEVYVVTPQMRAELSDEPTLHDYEVFTAKNSNGTLFIFPVRLPSKDGKWNSWHLSQHDAPPDRFPRLQDRNSGPSLHSPAS